MSNKKEDITVTSTGGMRFNKNKARLSWVPASLDEAVAEVLYKSSEQGGGKYPKNNWQKGLIWTEVADSALRHLKAWVAGQDLDSESGLPHLAHIATNITFLLEYAKTHPELDDRLKKYTDILPAAPPKSNPPFLQTCFLCGFPLEEGYHLGYPHTCKRKACQE